MKDYPFKTQEEAIKYIQKLFRRIGTTPGEKVFYKESGMKLYPLQKLGFSNYGQLVREAELPPNKFDKTKYTEDFLIKEFIKMIRKNKKWPTKAELDIKHFNDPNFPTSATFYKKFGLVKGMAENILDYTYGKKGYKDVRDICNEILMKYDNSMSNEEGDSRSGYVYILKNGGRQEYKIGISDSIPKRGMQLSTLSPENLELIHSIKATSPKAVERFLHDKFNSKRIQGEWFNLSTSDIKWIKKWNGNVL